MTIQKPINTASSEYWNLYSEYEKYKAALEKAVFEFKSHLATMRAINENLGYQFSQPLINAHEKIRDIEQSIHDGSEGK